MFFKLFRFKYHFNKNGHLGEEKNRCRMFCSLLTVLHFFSSPHGLSSLLCAREKSATVFWRLVVFCFFCFFFFLPSIQRALPALFLSGNSRCYVDDVGTRAHVWSSVRLLYRHNVGDEFFFLK